MVYNRKMKNYLLLYLKRAPFSLAYVRAVECRLLSNNKMKSPILDIGAGDGLFAKIFFNRAQKVYGVDMDQKEVELARKSGAYCQVKIGDALDMPFNNNYFQTVFTNSVLEHTYSLPLAIREIRRVLKKGGKVYVTIPSDRFTKELFFTKFFRKIGLSFLADIYEEFFIRIFKVNKKNLLSISDWKKEFKKVGLNIIEYKYYNVHYFWHEIFLPLALHGMFWKKITGRWVIFEKQRKIYAPWIAKMFYRSYLKNSSFGGSLLMVAEKV